MSADDVSGGGGNLRAWGLVGRSRSLGSILEECILLPVVQLLSPLTSSSSLPFSPLPSTPFWLPQSDYLCSTCAPHFDLASTQAQKQSSQINSIWPSDRWWVDILRHFVTVTETWLTHGRPRNFSGEEGHRGRKKGRNGVGWGRRRKGRSKEDTRKAVRERGRREGKRQGAGRLLMERYPHIPSIFLLSQNRTIRNLRVRKEASFFEIAHIQLKLT